MIVRVCIERNSRLADIVDESERPDCVRWKAAPTTDLLDGLEPSLVGTSPRGFTKGWKRDSRALQPDRWRPGGRRPASGL